jgi:hypothetical protein
MAVGAGIDFTDPHSPLARYYLRTSDVIATALIAVVFLLINFAPLWHTDIWGHLAFGKWIVEHRVLPERDPLCPYATEGSGYLHYSWLGQAGLYLVYHLGEILAGGDDLSRMAGGVAALRFTHALLLALRLFVLLVAFRRLSGSAAIATAGLALVVVLSAGNLAVLRPQVLGELFFACVLLALSRPVLSKRALLAVPVLLVMWANTHGSFAAGLILLAAATLGRAIEALLASGRWDIREVARDPQLRRLVLVGLVSGVAIAVLNPSGPSLYLGTIAMASHPNVLAMGEWQPLPLGLGGGGGQYLILLALLAGTRFLSRQRFSPTVIVLILAFGIQPLFRQRMLVWWLMVAPWLMVRYWPACLERLGSLRILQSVPSFRKTLVAGMLVALVLLWSIPAQWLIAGQPPAIERSLSGGTPWRLTYQLTHPDSTDPRGMPQLRKLLAAHYPGGRFTGGVFASETLGDLPIWDLAPQVPVFIYTHVHLFPAEHWQRCLAVRSGSTAGREVLDRYHVNLVVVEPDLNPRLCAWLRADLGWQVLADDSQQPAGRDTRQRLFIALRLRPL